MTFNYDEIGWDRRNKWVNLWQTHFTVGLTRRFAYKGRY
ncbi:hypothetical protein GARC_4884 [Paraglaciecola arctica BSs20135]|uniref:Uncharacterized protein n=1 Tax=Paraglaciecola arctica BSs20135 TaxID=493475 RepID=K6YD33_9ALTE|nr:hypothetical protein GARC_4884 [Paraglaciecola arctica BSs20135]